MGIGEFRVLSRVDLENSKEELGQVQRIIVDCGDWRGEMSEAGVCRGGAVGVMNLRWSTSPEGASLSQSQSYFAQLKIEAKKKSTRFTVFRFTDTERLFGRIVCIDFMYSRHDSSTPTQPDSDIEPQAGLEKKN